MGTLLLFTVLGNMHFIFLYKKYVVINNKFTTYKKKEEKEKNK